MSARLSRLCSLALSVILGSQLQANAPPVQQDPSPVSGESRKKDPENPARQAISKWLKTIQTSPPTTQISFSFEMSETDSGVALIQQRGDVYDGPRGEKRLDVYQVDSTLPFICTVQKDGVWMVYFDYGVSIESVLPVNPTGEGWCGQLNAQYHQTQDWHATLTLKRFCPNDDAVWSTNQDGSVHAVQTPSTDRQVPGELIFTLDSANKALNSIEARFSDGSSLIASDFVDISSFGRRPKVFEWHYTVDGKPRKNCWTIEDYIPVSAIGKSVEFNNPTSRRKAWPDLLGTLRYDAAGKETLDRW